MRRALHGWQTPTGIRGNVASKQEVQFSVVAVKAGLLSPQQVQECMDIQRGWQEKGKDVQLLAIYLKKGYLDKDQIRSLQSVTQQATLAKSVSLETAMQIDRFKFLAKVGEGGVASVFHAIDSAGRDVAVKILFPVHAANPTFVQRFFDEGKFLIELDHPNLVKGFEVGLWPPDYQRLPPEQRLHYMTMEFVRGKSVQDDLNENGPMPEAKALFVITQIAEALDYLSQRNCVHRDIKPDNILYADDGTIKLCDLGFAKEIEDASEGETEDTTCGTVQYIAPEQARGFRDVDIRADIYSLGATLFHLVIGEVPFSGKDSMDIMAKQVLESLESDKYRKRGLSQFIGYFIEKMMAKEREIRYQTPREVIEDISQITRGASELIYNAEDDPTVRKFAAIAGGGSNSSKRPMAATTRKLTPPGKSTLPNRNGAGGGAPAADEGSRLRPPAKSTSKLPLRPNLKRPKRPR